MQRLPRCAGWGMLICWLSISNPAVLPGNDVDDYNALQTQLVAAMDAGRYREAEQIAKRALELAEGPLRNPQTVIAASLDNVSWTYQAQGRFAEAEPLCKRALAIREKILGPDHPEVGDSLNNLGGLYKSLNRFREAEPLYKRSLAIREKALGPGNTDVALSLQNLADLYIDLGAYESAEPLYQRARSIFEKALGSDHPLVAQSLNRMALLFEHQGRYREAESLHKRALAVREKKLGAAHPDVADSLNNLANLYRVEGNFKEAEPLYERARAIWEKAYSPEHPDVATVINNLANVYAAQGRYVEAEPLYKRSLAIRQKIYGAEHTDVAMSLQNLGTLYFVQGRLAEAEPLYRRSVAIEEQALGPEHTVVATSLHNLANCYLDQHKYSEAETLSKRALAIREKVLGKENPAVAQSLNSLATLCEAQGRYADAEPLYKRALAIWEKTLGAEHPDVAITLRNLAVLYGDLNKPNEAEGLIDRAITIQEKAGSVPGERCWGYFVRSQIAWNLDKKKSAVDDLARAMDLAEEARRETSGAEQERAQHFSKFGEIFETMVARQLEMGDLDEAFRTIERSRARSLLDEMNRSKVDLDAGRTPEERARIRERQTQLRTRVAELEKKIELTTGSGQKGEGELAKLRSSLAQAREELYEHYRDERSTNPIYREMLTLGAAQPSLDEVRQKLTGPRGWALIYLIGEKGGYVLNVNPDDTKLIVLEVDEVSAKVLGTSAGPLNATRLREILIGKNNDGIVPKLAKRQSDPNLASRLQALFPILIPETQRSELTSGKFDRLVIFPDGPLALLPFETLVVQQGDNPQYLLDDGPPILYGPSASVLYNLAERPTALKGNRKPVLTVSDPVYQAEGTDQLASRAPSALGGVTTNSRYAGVGGHLNRLPFTGAESQAVSDAFTNAGAPTGKLERDQATEEIVRFNVSGRKIVHLACHGLADQAYGNFFGALALTPGKQAKTNPADDGFLTLPEIYELNLKGCELAILSACETNFGPQQQGEGTWALSRGFLVAGARRAVASNWLVDDEAGASLIGYCCRLLAQDEKQGTALDYAARLQAAKKWIRNQDKWRSPYYWSTFVLVGPN